MAAPDEKLLDLSNLTQSLDAIRTERANLELQIVNATREVDIQTIHLENLKSERSSIIRERGRICKSIERHSGIFVRHMEEEMRKERSELAQRQIAIAELKSDLRKIQIKKEKVKHHIKRTTEDQIDSEARAEKFVMGLPSGQKLRDLRGTAAVARRKLMIARNQNGGNLDEVLKIEKALQKEAFNMNLANNALEAESVRRTQELQFLENRNNKLQTDVRMLESKLAAKKIRLSKTQPPKV